MLRMMPTTHRQLLIGLTAGFILAFAMFSFNLLAYTPMHFAVFQSYHEEVYNRTDYISYNKTYTMSKERVLLFNDTHMHNDDDSLARKLREQFRVLVWVMTSPSNLQKRATAVMNTWGRRCNKILFFSSEDNATFPTIGLKVPEGREHLTAKTMKAFRYIYEHHFNDADWFMKGQESISDYAISFHYVTPEKMQALEFYIYHLRPYGIDSGHQDLNRHEDKGLKH